MAKFLSFAVGWKKENKVSCVTSGNNCSLYDPSSESSEKMDLKLQLVNTNNGEVVEVKNFYVKELDGGAKTSQNGRPLPTHQVIVPIEEE